MAALINNILSGHYKNSPAGIYAGRQLGKVIRLIECETARNVSFFMWSTCAVAWAFKANSLSDNWGK